MSAIDTKSLDNINEQLEGITSVLDDYFNTIEKEINQAQDIAQSIIDEKTEEISKKIEDRIKPIRQKVVDTLKGQVEIITDKVAPIKPLWKILQGEITLDPTNLIQPIIDICTVLTAPYQPWIDLATEVAPKLVTLSENLQKIANYSPKIELPTGVTAPSLSIQIEPITLNDIGL